MHNRVKAKVVYIDEKWLKVRGKWFVVLDAETELPVLASLLGTTNKWSCIGIKLKQIGKIPLLSQMVCRDIIAYVV